MVLGKRLMDCCKTNWSHLDLWACRSSFQWTPEVIRLLEALDEAKSMEMETMEGWTLQGGWDFGCLKFGNIRLAANMCLFDCLMLATGGDWHAGRLAIQDLPRWCALRDCQGVTAHGRASPLLLIVFRSRPV